MIEIDFTQYQNELRISRRNDETRIYDPIRRKHIILQPEEWVRQLTLQYLLKEKRYKVRQIRVEFGLKVHDLQKRCDILIYDQNIQPFLLVECKSIHIPLDQAVFDQIARYNIALQVPFLMVTNGIATFGCQIDYQQKNYQFLSEIPCYDGK